MQPRRGCTCCRSPPRPAASAAPCWARAHLPLLPAGAAFVSKAPGSAEVQRAPALQAEEARASGQAAEAEGSRAPGAAAAAEAEGEQEGGAAAAGESEGAALRRPVQGQAGAAGLSDEWVAQVRRALLAKQGLQQGSKVQLGCAVSRLPAGWSHYQNDTDGRLYLLRSKPLSNADARAVCRSFGPQFGLVTFDSYSHQLELESSAAFQHLVGAGAGARLWPGSMRASQAAALPPACWPAFPPCPQRLRCWHHHGPHTAVLSGRQV
jgi:hypothetical protein